MTPEEIQDKSLFPKGFEPLPHPNHPEGGMLFPKFHLDEVKRQEGRDLTRFDLLDFDLPEQGARLTEQEKKDLLAFMRAL